MDTDKGKRWQKRVREREGDGVLKTWTVGSWPYRRRRCQTIDRNDLKQQRLTLKKAFDINFYCVYLVKCDHNMDMDMRLSPSIATIARCGK